MLQYIKLGEIAAILNGLSGAGPSKGPIHYNFIQPNHLGTFNEIQGVSKIGKQSPLDENYLIRKNDILLKRLNPDTVTLVIDDTENTTFSSNIFVIRILKDYYPAYIACLLENMGLAWLNSNIVGSVAAVRSMSLKALAALDIPILEYRKQEAIGQIWLLYKKRKKLLDELIMEDQRLMAAIVNNIATNTKEAL